ncbi:MAG: hypothetical protein ABI811_20340 [Acidobacteriota bacterium]
MMRTELFEWKGRQWPLLVFEWKGQTRFRCLSCQFDSYDLKLILKHTSSDHPHPEISTHASVPASPQNPKSWAEINATKYGGIAFLMIQEAGLNVTDFFRETYPPSFRIVYLPTQDHFAFGGENGRTYWTRPGYPGKKSQTGKGNPESWDSKMKHFAAWLARLKEFVLATREHSEIRPPVSSVRSPLEADRQATSELVQAIPAPQPELKEPVNRKRLGRKTKFTPEQLQQAAIMKNAGNTNDEIAKVLYGINVPTDAQRRSVPTILNYHDPQKGSKNRQFFDSKRHFFDSSQLAHVAVEWLQGFRSSMDPIRLERTKCDRNPQCKNSKNCNLADLR